MAFYLLLQLVEREAIRARGSKALRTALDTHDIGRRTEASAEGRAVFVELFKVQGYDETWLTEYVDFEVTAYEDCGKIMDMYLSICHPLRFL